MNTLDSIWWHEAAGRGRLASSHVAIVFCALVENSMIISEVSDAYYPNIPKISERLLSPMEYLVAYADGVIAGQFVVTKYRDKIATMISDGTMYDALFDNGLVQDATGVEPYTLECSWQNVDIFSEWIRREVVEAR